MDMIPTPINDLFLLRTTSQEDSRGSFQKYYDATQPLLESFQVKQLNHSINVKKGTVRGMHFQNTQPDAKIVICTKGAIFDCVIDVRPNSSTYGEKFSVVLSSNGGTSLFVPKGFAHGFQTLEKDSHVFYLHDEVYLPTRQNGISPLCKVLNIDWPLKVSSISERDSKLPDFETYLKTGENK